MNFGISYNCTLFKLNPRIYMFLRVLLFYILLLSSPPLISQDYELLGLIDNKIVKIDEQTGETSLKIEIKDLPNNTVISDLVYHEKKNIFYTIANPTNQPYIASISTSGEFQIRKQFDRESEIFYNIEAISLHDDEIYFSASLNGGRNESDFYAESLLKINKQNEVEFLSEINTEKPFPDIDAFHVNEDRIFIFDGAPESQNFLEFYELEFDNLNALSSPTNLYSSSYIPIADFCFYQNQLLFVAEKELYTFSNSIEKTIEINSEGNFSGLTQFLPCSLPHVDLQEKIVTCNKEAIILDVENPNSSYLWSDGSTNRYLIVKESGIYEVKVTNSCGSQVFTTEVSLEYPPQQIDFVTKPITCASYSLSLSNHNESLDYYWQDGTEDSIFTAKETGWYKLNISNNCGSKTDSVFVEIKDLSNIILPNIITPNGDQKNDKFVIDERLQQAAISIYNRYGKLVYQNPRYLNEWDSGNLNSGNYFYQITLNCGDIFKGWIEVRK